MARGKIFCNSRYLFQDSASQREQNKITRSVRGEAHAVPKRSLTLSSEHNRTLTETIHVRRAWPLDAEEQDLAPLSQIR